MYYPGQLASSDPTQSAANPYASLMSSNDTASAEAQMAQAVAALGQQSQQYAGYGAQIPTGTSSYPSYPNSYGLGSQNPMSGMSTQAVPQTGQSGPSYSLTPPSTTATTTNSNGFNPWSMQGESNSV